MPRLRQLLLAVPLGLLAAGPAAAQRPKPTPAPVQDDQLKPAAGAPKRVLLVTHSGGFIHDSVGVAEDVLTEIGPKYGLAVTTYRLTNPADPGIAGKKIKGGPAGLEAYAQEFRTRTGKTIDGEKNAGTINKETLKNFDCVLFFTTGNPMTADQTKELIEWVRAGGAFCGTHCATDTLYGDAAYGHLIGGYFSGHPSGLQDIKVRVEDPKHPAAAGFQDGEAYKDEMYVFGEPRPKQALKAQTYSRDRLHVILSIAPGSFDPGRGLARADADYAISWCREEGQGKVFYTSFGHQQKVWKDPKFQDHLMGGLKWAMGQAPGDATPSRKQ